MPDYRVIGYYRDNLQIYDGEASGDTEDDAIAGLRESMYPEEQQNLMIVAVLDEDGDNMHGSDRAFSILDWEGVPK